MNQHKPFKTFIASFTVFVFLVTSLGINPNAFAASAMPEVSLPYQVRLDENLRIAIPQELGKLEHFKMGQGPAIFHIQDVHGHYEGQQKIRQLLGFLTRTYGINTVLVEGSAFRLDSEKIRFFPKAMKKTLAVNEEFTRHAWVAGVELYLLDQIGERGTGNAERTVSRFLGNVSRAAGAAAYGIEEAESYRKNGRSFVDVLTQKQKTEQFLADMNMQIERLASHLLNKNLRDFLRRVESFEKNRIPLDTWLANLKGEAQKCLEIDLASPAHQLDWPMLVRIFKVQELSQKLDKQKFPKERDEFLRAISRWLPDHSPNSNQLKRSGNWGSPDYHQSKENKSQDRRQTTDRSQSKDLSLQSSVFSQIESLLHNDSMSQQLPDPETSLLFEDMVKRLPENFNYEAFPNVRSFIGILLLQSELKAEMLMREVQKLSEAITAKLTRNKKERKLVALLADHRLLQKLFALELTPADYEVIRVRSTEYKVRRQASKGGKEIKNNSLKPSELVSQMKKFGFEERGTPYALHRTKPVEFTHISDLDQLFDKAMKFYEGVKERDGKMEQKIEERLKETGATKVAVITGGFHSQPLKDYFVNKGYSYALITPKLSGADEAGHEDYVKAALASILPAKNTYKNPYVFTTANPASDGASLMGIKTAVVNTVLELEAGGVLTMAEARDVTHKLAGRTGQPTAQEPAFSLQSGKARSETREIDVGSHEAKAMRLENSTLSQEGEESSAEIKRFWVSFAAVGLIGTVFFGVVFYNFPDFAVRSLSPLGKVFRVIVIAPCIGLWMNLVLALIGFWKPRDETFVATRNVTKPQGTSDTQPSESPVSSLSSAVSSKIRSEARTEQLARAEDPINEGVFAMVRGFVAEGRIQIAINNINDRLWLIKNRSQKDEATILAFRQVLEDRLSQPKIRSEARVVEAKDAAAAILATLQAEAARIQNGLINIRFFKNPDDATGGWHQTILWPEVAQGQIKDPISGNFLPYDIQPGF